MLRFRVEDECVQIMPRGIIKVPIVLVSKADVDESAHVVGAKSDGLAVGLDRLLRVRRVGQSGTVLVPERVVHRVFLDGRPEVALGLGEVASDELDDAERVQDLGVGGLQRMRLVEGVLHLVELEVVASGLHEGNLREVRVVLKPLRQAAQRLRLLELVRRRDAE